MRYTTASELDKQETDQLGGHSDGTDSTTADAPEPGARDDAAADAGHQAAAALEPGSGRLRRGGARKEPAARTRRRRRAGRDRRRGRTGRARSSTATAMRPGEIGGRCGPHRRKPGDQPQRDRGAARHRSRKRISRRCEPIRRARRCGCARDVRPTGPASAAAAARMAITIWRPSCRPRRLSPIIWPSNCRWRSSIRSGG